MRGAIAIFLASASLGVQGTPILNITFGDNASFQVFLRGELWLQSSELRLFANGRWHVNAEQTPATEYPLVHSGVQRSRGTDKLGSFSLVNVSWSVLGSPSLALHTSLMVYDDGHTAVFQQDLPNGALDTNAYNPVLPGGFVLDDGASPPIVPFPAFDEKNGQLRSLGYVTWQGCMVNVDYGKSVLTHLKGLSSNGPVALFNGNSTVLVVSPMDNFKNAVHSYTNQNTWETGISSELTSLPPGFVHRTLLVAGSGITATMDAWGQTLRKAYGTSRVVDEDPVVNYLSFWTDNGAYYYGDIWGQAGGGGDPCNETSMLDVARGLDQQELLQAVKIWQLDDWWYPGHQKVYVHCVQNWTLTTPAFNHSLAWLSQQVRSPWLLYVPFFCPENVYSQSFPFILSTPGETQFAQPHPDHALAFYRNLFDDGVRNGMRGYENDFLNFNFLSVPFFRQNYDASRKWLKGIGLAAAERQVHVQLCMALPSDLMQSVELDSVTNYRASGDYASSDNYDIGGSSLLAFALDLRPSKDNFWTHRPQSAISTGMPWNTKSNPGSNCELNAIISTLSTGPVGIADKAGDTNKTLVMRSIRLDGLILQPDRPASYIDAMFMQTLPSSRSRLVGMIWTTMSAVASSGAPLLWHYALSIDVTSKWQLSEKDFYPVVSASSGWVARRWHDGNLPTACIVGQAAIQSGCILGPSIYSEADMPWILNDRPAMVRNDTHVYDLIQLVPILANGWILLGEVDKYVSVSSKRFQRIVFTSSGLRLKVAGAAGEKVCITALQPKLHDKDWFVIEKCIFFKSTSSSNLEIQTSPWQADSLKGLNWVGVMV